MKYQRVEIVNDPRIRFEVLNELQLMLIDKFPDLTKREAQKILDMAEEELLKLLKQGDDNIHTNS